MRKTNLSIFLIILVLNLFGNENPKCDTIFWSHKKVRQIECRNSKTYSLRNYKILYDSIGNKTEEWVFTNNRYHIISYWKDKTQLVKYGNGQYETFFTNGKTHSKGKIFEGEKKDTWSFFYPNGKLSHLIKYEYCYKCYCCSQLNLNNGYLINSFDTNGSQIFINNSGQFKKYNTFGEIEKTYYISNNTIDSLKEFKNNILYRVFLKTEKYKDLEVARYYHENSMLAFEQKNLNDTFFHIYYYSNGEVKNIYKHYDSFVQEKLFYQNGSIKVDYYYIDCTYQIKDGPGGEVCIKEIYRKEWDENGNEVK